MHALGRPRALLPAWLAGLLLLTLAPAPACLAAEASGGQPVYQKDRGTGIATSLFGTYVAKRELLVYLFYEPTFDSNLEYKPSEFGLSLDQDFRGKYTEHEKLVFLSYGLTDRIAFEVESAVHTTATLRRDPADPSGLPPRLEESGLGDTQAEVRWRWTPETERRPELYSYFESVFPLQRTRQLIGTHEWELILGAGAIKGGPWGTLSARASAVYSDQSVDTDELEVEYLKRMSQSFRWVAAVEGDQDEWAAVGEVQWFLRPSVYLKLNNAFGITSKAPDFAPEAGILFSL